MEISNTSKQQLKDIQDLMERSSRFISLSGLSGVFAGITALIGGLFAFFYLNFDERYFNIDLYFEKKLFQVMPREIYMLFFIALLILTIAIGSAIFFTTRKARKKGLPVWTITTRNMLLNLAVPLISGGLFCIILTYYKLIFLIAPTSLLFYGLSLLNASKYTLPEIRWLALSEIILGLIAMLFLGYGLVFWMLGFGILHILYGTIMYFKYDKEPRKG